MNKLERRRLRDLVAVNRPVTPKAVLEIPQPDTLKFKHWPLPKLRNQVEILERATEEIRGLKGKERVIIGWLFKDLICSREDWVGRPKDKQSDCLGPVVFSLHSFLPAETPPLLDGHSDIWYRVASILTISATTNGLMGLLPHETLTHSYIRTRTDNAESFPNPRRAHITQNKESDVGKTPSHEYQIECGLSGTGSVNFELHATVYGADGCLGGEIRLQQSALAEVLYAYLRDQRVRSDAQLEGFWKRIDRFRMLRLTQQV